MSDEVGDQEKNNNQASFQNPQDSPKSQDQDSVSSHEVNSEANEEEGTEEEEILFKKVEPESYSNASKEGTKGKSSEKFVEGYGQLNQIGQKMGSESEKPLPNLVEKKNIVESGAGFFEERVQPVKKGEFGAFVDDFDPHEEKYGQNLDTLLNVKFDFIVEVGRVSMKISDILLLGQGSVIELEKLVGDELNLMVNDKWIARGEIIINKGRFGTRVNHILSAEERLKKLGSSL